VVSFTPLPLYPRRKSPPVPIGGWVGPRSGLNDVEKRKFLTLPRLELRPLGRPARSQLLYRLRCTGYIYMYQIDPCSPKLREQCTLGLHCLHTLANYTLLILSKLSPCLMGKGTLHVLDVQVHFIHASISEHGEIIWGCDTSLSAFAALSITKSSLRYNVCIALLTHKTWPSISTCAECVSYFPCSWFYIIHITVTLRTASWSNCSLCSVSVKVLLIAPRGRILRRTVTGAWKWLYFLRFARIT
jgi:hypothetical protein